MNRRRYKAEFNNRTFVIEEDLPEVGWYLYVYEGTKCTHDYLQDTKAIAMSQAEEDFGVPLAGWIEINDDLHI